MALERNGAQHHMAVVDKYHDPAASYTMTTRDYVMRPTVAAAAIIITLPPITEAKGRFYTIFAAGNVTNALPVTVIQNNDDSEGWPEDIILNESGRGITLYSDGRKWHYGEKHFTSSLIVGAINLEEIHLVVDTDGAANPDALIVRLEPTAIVGNSAGAIFAQVNYSDATARVQGLSYAVGAEMILPNAVLGSGHYTCIDFELSAGATTDWDPDSQRVSYMRFAAWGTQTAIDDDAVFFQLSAAAAVDHLLSVNAQTLRLEIMDGATSKDRFLVMSTEQNILRHVSTVLTGNFGMHITGAIDDGISEGAAAYFQANVTGTPPGTVMGTGIWTNINEAPVSGAIRNLDIGIYSGADLAGADVFNLYMSIITGGGASNLTYQFGFNHNGDAIDGLFWAFNPGSIAMDVADPTGAGGAADARIKFRVGGNTYYLAVYDA